MHPGIRMFRQAVANCLTWFYRFDGTGSGFDTAGFSSVTQSGTSRVSGVGVIASGGSFVGRPLGYASPPDTSVRILRAGVTARFDPSETCLIRIDSWNSHIQLYYNVDAELAQVIYGWPGNAILGTDSASMASLPVDPLGGLVEIRLDIEVFGDLGVAIYRVELPTGVVQVSSLDVPVLPPTSAIEVVFTLSGPMEVNDLEVYECAEASWSTYPEGPSIVFGGANSIIGVSAGTAVAIPTVSGISPGDCLLVMAMALDPSSSAAHAFVPNFSSGWHSAGGILGLSRVASSAAYQVWAGGALGTITFPSAGMHYVIVTTRFSGHGLLIEPTTYNWSGAGGTEISTSTPDPLTFSFPQHKKYACVSYVMVGSNVVTPTLTDPFGYSNVHSSSATTGGWTVRTSVAVKTLSARASSEDPPAISISGSRGTYAVAALPPASW